MNNYISINNLSKIYSNKFHALNNINLDIKKGEIFALLGPNGAGKTTLINIICGIVSPTSGKITVNNFDIISNYKKARSLIGIVPQELTVEAFETVFDNVSYSRGLYGKSSNPQYIESLLKGNVVSTGTCTVAIPLEKSDKIKVDFADMGNIDFQFN